jgi:hypothetical protein
MPLHLEVQPGHQSTPGYLRARANVADGSRAAVAGRRMAQPVYPQLRKCPCVPAFALRAKYGGDAYFAASQSADCSALGSIMDRHCG